MKNVACFFLPPTTIKQGTFFINRQLFRIARSLPEVCAFDEARAAEARDAAEKAGSTARILIPGGVARQGRSGRGPCTRMALRTLNPVVIARRKVSV